MQPRMHSIEIMDHFITNTSCLGIYLLSIIFINLFNDEAPWLDTIWQCKQTTSSPKSSDYLSALLLLRRNNHDIISIHPNIAALCRFYGKVN